MPPTLATTQGRVCRKSLKTAADIDPFACRNGRTGSQRGLWREGVSLQRPTGRARREGTNKRSASRRYGGRGRPPPGARPSRQVSTARPLAACRTGSTSTGRWREAALLQRPTARKAGGNYQDRRLAALWRGRDALPPRARPPFRGPVRPLPEGPSISGFMRRGLLAGCRNGFHIDGPLGGGRLALQSFA